MTELCIYLYFYDNKKPPLYRFFDYCGSSNFLNISSDKMFKIPKNLIPFNNVESHVNDNGIYSYTPITSGVPNNCIDGQEFISDMMESITE